MTKDDSGHAFPTATTELEPNLLGQYEPARTQHSGMTLRQWYAGQALRGAADCVCEALEDADAAAALGESMNVGAALAAAQAHADRHARACLMVADAMLAEGKRGDGDAK